MSSLKKKQKLIECEFGGYVPFFLYINIVEEACVGISHHSILFNVKNVTIIMQAYYQQ